MDNVINLTPITGSSVLYLAHNCPRLTPLVVIRTIKVFQRRNYLLQGG